MSCMRARITRWAWQTWNLCALALARVGRLLCSCTYFAIRQMIIRDTIMILSCQWKDRMLLWLLWTMVLLAMFLLRPVVLSLCAAGAAASAAFASSAPIDSYKYQCHQCHRQVRVRR